MHHKLDCAKAEGKELSTIKVCQEALKELPARLVERESLSINSLQNMYGKWSEVVRQATFLSTCVGVRLLRS